MPSASAIHDLLPAERFVASTIRSHRGEIGRGVVVLKKECVQGRTRD